MKKTVVLTLMLFLTFSILGCSSGLYSGSPKRGVVTDGVYTNDYFKLSFIIPEGWYAFTDEEVFERTGNSLPTDEDLAKSKIAFGDAFFYITVEQKDRIRIAYNAFVNITYEQIKNQLSAQNSDVEFGDIEDIKIGEADYAMISRLSPDGTLNYYYIWNQNVCGYLRPVIYMQLDSSKSAQDILKNFTQALNIEK